MIHSPNLNRPRAASVRELHTGLATIVIVTLLSGCAAASGLRLVYAAPQQQTGSRTVQLTAQQTARRAYRLPSERDGSVTLGRPQKTPPGRVVIPKRGTPALRTPDKPLAIDSSEPVGPQLGAPSTEKQSMQPLEGPVLGAPERPAQSELELDIRSPSSSQVGADITFELTVRNRTGAAIDDVSIESEFDSALKFPGSERTRVRQKLSQLAAGEERPMALTLVGDKEGTACSRFVVSIRGAEAVWKSVCVDVSAQKAGLKLFGPKVRYVGDRAEFTGKIVNTSKQTWKRVEAVCNHPSELVPREASTGVTQSEGALTWQLGDLEPGEGVQLQVEFDCASAADQATVALRLSAEGGVEERAETELRMSRPTSPVQARLSDTSDLINVGEETEYLVKFENSAPRTRRLGDLVLELPEQLHLISADTQPHDGNKLEVSKNRVSVPQGFEVPGNGTAVIRVRAKGTNAGDGMLRVQWRPSESRSSEPVELDEPTTVNR